MAQILAAPSPVAIRPLGAQDVRRSTRGADQGLPFARQQAVTPGGWIAGIVFGLVCIGAGVVMVVACVVLAVVLTVVALVPRSDRSLSSERRRSRPGRTRRR